MRPFDTPYTSKSLFSFEINVYVVTTRKMLFLRVPFLLPQPTRTRTPAKNNNNEKLKLKLKKILIKKALDKHLRVKISDKNFE